jgi:hypothetical protein
MSVWYDDDTADLIPASKEVFCRNLAEVKAARREEESSE